MGWQAVAVGLVLGAFGLLAFVTGLRGVLTAQRLRRNGVWVPGVVVSVRIVSRDETNDRYPTLRFPGPDGTERVVESDVSSMVDVHEGQPVTVVYDPADPGRARIVGASGDGTLHGALALAIGSVITIGAVVWTLAALG